MQNSEDELKQHMVIANNTKKYVIDKALESLLYTNFAGTICKGIDENNMSLVIQMWDEYSHKKEFVFDMMAKLAIDDIRKAMLTEEITKEEKIPEDIGLGPYFLSTLFEYVTAILYLAYKYKTERDATTSSSQESLKVGVKVKKKKTPTHAPLSSPSDTGISSGITDPQTPIETISVPSSPESSQAEPNQPPVESQSEPEKPVVQSKNVAAGYTQIPFTDPLEEESSEETDPPSSSEVKTTNPTQIVKKKRKTETEKLAVPLSQTSEDSGTRSGTQYSISSTQSTEVPKTLFISPDIDFAHGKKDMGESLSEEDDDDDDEDEEDESEESEEEVEVGDSYFAEEVSDKNLANLNSPFMNF